MNIKQLIITIIITTLICWLVWFMVLFQFDPKEGVMGILIFYTSLFFALAGTFFLFSFTWRKLLNKLALEYKIVGKSFRQSVFFSVLAILMLFLQSQSLLTWWNIILLVLGVSILEFLFISARRSI